MGILYRCKFHHLDRCNRCIHHRFWMFFQRGKICHYVGNLPSKWKYFTDRLTKIFCRQSARWTKNNLIPDLITGGVAFSFMLAVWNDFPQICYNSTQTSIEHYRILFYPELCIPLINVNILKVELAYSNILRILIW